MLGIGITRSWKSRGTG